MTDYPQLLMNARFYGAKSQPIDEVLVIDSRALGDARLEILAVTQGGHTDLYQVLIDGSATDALTRLADRYVHAVANGTVGDIHGSIPVGDDISPIDGEQSNTSLIAGDVMVKAFRKLEAGLNPDVELLSQIGECPNVAKVHGWVTRTINGEEYTLAMVQDLVHGGHDGWELALEHAAGGKSFATQAHELGRALRTVHDALAEAFGTEEVALDDLVQSLTEHARQLAHRNGEIAGVEKDAVARYAELAGGRMPIQRIHGDLHLGQTLRTDQDWILIDFEGEPARPLAQRRLPDSPLRDVAGMMRSIDYAAHFGAGAPAGWAEDATHALLAGYGTEPSPLLSAYVLDKALYEVVYETDNRPEWVSIPNAAVHRILG